MRTKQRTTRSAQRPVQAPRRAFTLVEAVISSVIVSIMLVAALGTLGATAKARHIQARQNLGPVLAAQLMTEILAARYEEPGFPNGFGRDAGEGNASRVNWDDVDDYDWLWDEPPSQKDNSPVSVPIGWRREVRVEYADPATLAGVGTASDTALKLIKVTVTAPNGEQTLLSAVRSRHGAVEQAPPVDMSYVMWIGVNLEVENTSPPPMHGVNLLNHVIGGP